MDSLSLAIFGGPAPAAVPFAANQSDTKCSLTRLTPSVVHAHVLPCLSSGRVLLAVLARVNRAYRALVCTQVPNGLWYRCLMLEFSASELAGTEFVKKYKTGGGGAAVPKRANDSKSKAAEEFVVSPRDMDQLIAPRATPAPPPAMPQPADGKKKKHKHSVAAAASPPPTAAALPPLPTLDTKIGYAPGCWFGYYKTIAGQALAYRKRLRASAAGSNGDFGRQYQSGGADFTFKVILCGHGGAGKTSLVRRYALEQWDDRNECTIQASFLVKTVTLPTSSGVPRDEYRRRLASAGSKYSNAVRTVGGAAVTDTSLTRKIQLQIWDTAGPERFHALGPIYYRGANGAVICVDCTDPDVNDLKRCVEEFRRFTGNDTAQLVVAITKTDLKQKDRSAEIVDWVENYNRKQATASTTAAATAPPPTPLAVFLTSAKTNAGVSDAFQQIAEHTFAVAESVDRANGVLPPSPGGGIVASTAAAAAPWSCVIA